MPQVAIAGAGIAGLVFALGFKKHLGITPQVYEQAARFDDEVGGAIGMYPNGLKVIRDISPLLLLKIRENAKPFVYRRWTRHDGSEVAVGQEKYLLKYKNEQDAEQLSSIGLRRWKLQKALLEECIEQGIQVHFGKRVEMVENTSSGVQVNFADSTVIECDYLFGCDGVKSLVRSSLFGPTDPQYTGITCLMGSAPMTRKDGICLLSSTTTKCHACYYPTGENEQVFQIYFATPEKPETWKPLSAQEGTLECEQLAQILEKDGWDKQFTEPLHNANSVIRVGLRARDPIPVWHTGKVVLLGDAAHPPVPYIGQGAMMAIEDAGILLMLLKHYCGQLALDSEPKEPKFMDENFDKAVAMYQLMRLPRTTEMLKRSQQLGDLQLARASAPSLLQKHGTLPTMWFGSGFDYKSEVTKAINSSKL